MKSKLFVVLMAAAAILTGFSACENAEGPYIMGTEAELAGLDIAGIRLPIEDDPTTEDVNEARPIPAFIDNDDWEDYDWNPTVDTPYQTMQFLRADDIVKVRIRPYTTGKSSGATVEWGIGDQVTRPAVFEDVRVPATFYAEDFIYLRVTSENRLRTQYYRFYARVFKSGVNLASLQFDSKRKDENNDPIIKTILAADGAKTWDLLTQDTQIGNMALSESQAANLLIDAIGFEETSTFQFARVDASLVSALDAALAAAAAAPTDAALQAAVEAARANAAPVNWVSETTPIDFTDGDNLYVEVTAQNTVDKEYYRFFVSVGRIVTIEKLEFMDGTTPFLVTDLGAPGTTWSGITGARNGSFATADLPTNGYGIRIALEDDEATMSWVNTTPATVGGTPAEPTFPANAAASAQTIKFANTKTGLKDVLGIRVVSKNGKATRYYKIEVSLLPANFLLHPRSAVYYYWADSGNKAADEPNGSNTRYSPAGLSGNARYVTTAEPLYVLMDRDDGDYTYQWYESNSWYGGYIFDRYGYTVKDGAKVTANQVPDLETGFSEDPYHSRQADEKANISLFNGGNQVARYIVPGYEIEGATSSTYTPSIKKRPFLPSYTNEAHYYWVVVKDENTGYTMTSERAVIISERDASKDHFIVDVNNTFEGDWLPETAFGSGIKDTGATYADVLAKKIPFKNSPAFQKKYDKYAIPLADVLPGDWDVMDYSILTAQAKFYLKDGTPWIQNWTQGNLSFEEWSDDTDPDGKPTVKRDIIVLYYNLTNNNAGILLASDSKEPEGAALLVTPTHIVIEPSGDHTKGPNKDGYPALTSTGTASSSIVGSDLQGWFCGFIELCELRFEGPKRTE